VPTMLPGTSSVWDPCLMDSLYYLDLPAMTLSPII